MKKLTVTRQWRDLDYIFQVGDVITVEDSEVADAQARVKEYGKSCNLLRYGMNHIPLSHVNIGGTDNAT